MIETHYYGNYFCQQYYNNVYIMSIMSSYDQGLLQKQFFAFYFNPQYSPNSLFPPLKDKYKAYKHQSYFTPRPISEVNYVKKFEQTCEYLCYVGALKPQKVEIALIQDLIEQIMNDFEKFFVEGGWKLVKNKSNRCKLQQYLLLKLAKLFSQHRHFKTLDNFVLSFFYTLNYFKTCNYEIKLFNEFLIAHTDLDYFFLYIILRKLSRRHLRDLVIKSQCIASIVAVLKSEQTSTPHGISMYENDELGQVKLLLIFTQIIEYIKTNAIVLHESMIYNLMRCAGLVEEPPLSKFNKLNWAQFITSYFSQICDTDKNYPQTLIQEAVKSNLKLADKMFGVQKIVHNQTQQSSDIVRERYLQESFSWLINNLQNLIYKKNASQEWSKLYEQGVAVYDYGFFVGRHLVKQLMSSPQFYSIYLKHCEKSTPEA